MEWYSQYFVSFQKKNTTIDQLNYIDKELFKNKDKANGLNEVFTNIGPSVEHKIPKPKHNFQEYLKNPNIQTLMHQPCDSNEIIDIIKEFKTSKACGPYSIPVNLIKSSYTILVPILTNIINKSLTQGEFPNLS